MERSSILSLQESMRIFPQLLEQHFSNNDIFYTKADTFRILNCFKNGAMVIDGEIDDFKDFLFPEGDIILLQQMAEYTRRNEHYFEDCNPNAVLPTISTLIGRLYTFAEAESEGIQGTSVVNIKFSCIIHNVGWIRVDVNCKHKYVVQLVTICEDFF